MAVQRSAQSSTSTNFQIRHAWIERLPTSSHARIELCLPHVAQLINRTSECGGSRGQAGKRRCGWREEEEGRRRGKESNQGFLATRNPVLLSVSPGKNASRWEERALPALLVHEPPRTTRVSPDTGPSGFVCAALE